MSVQSSRKRRNASLIAMLCASLYLPGCADVQSVTTRTADKLPPADAAKTDQMREVLVDESKKLTAAQDELNSGINVHQETATLAPVAPTLDPLETKTISISMSGATVSQLLTAFADQAHLNLVVEPEVLKLDKRADMHLKNVSLREVFNEVMRVFDLTGETRGNTLRVKLMDERMFSLDLLNTSMTLDLSAGGNVFGANSSSGSSGGGSGGSSSGGSNALRGNVTLSGSNGGKSDPYEQIELAVKRILGETDGKQRAQAGGDTDAASGIAGEEPQKVAYSLNRVSGGLYVRARPSQIRSIEKMLDRTQKVLRRQVQIEAQLIDVQLNDGFELGVDWNLLRKHAAGNFGVNPTTLNSLSTTMGSATGLQSRVLTIPAQLVGSATSASLGMTYQTGSFGAVLSALRSFGNLKVLSNPSVMVRNGAPALLSVGTSSRYVSKSSVTTTTPGGGASTTSSNVETDSVFAGVMVGVVPYIRDDGRIDLMVHPMQTDVNSASMQLVSVGGNQITLPVVNYKGMTTTLNVNDGDTVMIGGLIDQRSADNDNGAPGVSNIPLLGTLFSHKSKTNSSRELVMVLRVKVL